MLLEFKTKNYKSFKDEMIFSMEQQSPKRGLSYSITKTKINKNLYKTLSSGIIYGPNAAGKTNIIGAMDTLKKIILRGNIKNTDLRNTANVAAEALELIPNVNFAHASPIEFVIKFICGSDVFEYGLSFYVGTFLQEDFPRKIINEYFNINEEQAFHRDATTVLLNPTSSLQYYLTDSMLKNLDSAIEIANHSLIKDELFLVNGFKNIISPRLVEKITKWISSKFMVIYQANEVSTIRRFADPSRHSVYIDETINEAAKNFGINSNALAYVNNGENDVQLCSMFAINHKTIAIPSEMYESFGTCRFINLFPLVINALYNGGTLIVDEFDASIHPMALMNIINIFHNDEINKNHAQLIFNTQNPIFLNSNLYRTDEIHFVERDEGTHCSTHYLLSDFQTEGKGAVRSTDDYMINYFVNRYGAISDIDFSEMIEKILSQKEGGKA